MGLPAVVAELIDRFEAHQDTYRSAEYNEAQLREEFLNPLFEALGWDVYNRKGYAEVYKEVIHEDAIKIGGRTKAPDYCLRAGGGMRSLFVEAKKPSVDIGEAASPAYQLRRYAWSAKLPVSILTDFQELAVYDCRIRPARTDKAATARIIFRRYTEYVDCWDELVSLFSPEAIRRGSLERLVASKKIKKGTAEVDAAFLGEIELWRTDLARNMALRNPDLSQRDLNFAVQRTIDRIIFLRICEDRGIEPYGTLESLQNAPNIYRRLSELFERADERYNSGLFHFAAEKDRPEPPDELTLGLQVDDKPLQEILQKLYFPESPYEFSVFRVEILGQVYEQFLGKVIRLTKGHQAKVEEKPEVRKAGGVYYTPGYIVDYIVRHTVGKLLEGGTRKSGVGVGKSEGSGENEGGKGERKMTPAQAAKLHILDPACGSGSFLIRAYQYLLDWHRDWYTTDGAEKHAKGRHPKLCRGRAGEWRLTTAEKKRILLNNVYGVDIDRQAVEVTKLSLLLAVLEGESKETVNNQLRLLHERALPDLAGNIKCGNSLIGPDFYHGRQKNMLDGEEVYRINAFDWHREFPEVFKAGGFDAVIGNPPYGGVFGTEETGYLGEKLGVFRKVPDAYVAFVEQAYRLMAEDGAFGFIIPSAWMGGPTYAALREFLLQSQIDSLVVLPFDIFKDAYIDTLLVTTRKRLAARHHRVLAYEFPKRTKLEKVDLQSLPISRIQQLAWAKTEDKKFVVNVGLLGIMSGIRGRLAATFADLVEMRRGVLFDPALLTGRRTSDTSYRYFEGDVYRYRVNMVAKRWVEFGPEMREYPREFKWFEGERILLRRLVNRQQRLMASLVRETVVSNKNLYSVRATTDKSVLYVLGLLNSRLISRLYLAHVTQATKDDFPQVTIRDVLRLPAPNLDLGRCSDNGRHDRMVEMVETILALHKTLAAARTADDKTALQRQIDATDRQIDQFVYELYSLTDEEIKIVEESSQTP